jgi:hypothetical protein
MDRLAELPALGHETEAPLALNVCTGRHDHS